VRGDCVKEVEMQVCIQSILVVDRVDLIAYGIYEAPRGA
jgi:hypothetical protein